MSKKVDIETFYQYLDSVCNTYGLDDRLSYYEELLETGSVEIEDLDGIKWTFTIESFQIENSQNHTELSEEDINEIDAIVNSNVDDDLIDLEQLDREAAAMSETTENDIKDVFTESEDPQPIQKCRVCGCTQERACPGGCYWVEPDLCSSCEGIAEQIEISFGYFKYADESSDRVQILETVGLACDFNSVEEAEAFIHGYATALGLESAFENEAEKYPCQTIEFVVSVNGNYITGFEFFYEGDE